MKKLMILCTLLWTTFSLSAQDTATVNKIQYPKGFSEQLNVVYTKVNGWEGKLDLYLPPTGGAASPLVINIHGGGWNKGTKESQGGFSPFFKKGYTVANIEYRLTAAATAPAAIEDTRCALIYLISHAKTLNIDVSKIVIMGASAGGHLALMGGLMENDHLFDGNCKGIENIKVAAIIDKYGITDVWDWGYGKLKTSKSATSWLGAKAEDTDFAKSVSPLYQVKKSSPPVFIVHGDADPIVPYEQSVALKAKLDEMGVKNEFITVKGGLHGKFPAEEHAMVNAKIMEFLKGLGL
jgi:acetyl esterase/lipase